MTKRIHIWIKVHSVNYMLHLQELSSFVFFLLQVAWFPIKFKIYYVEFEGLGVCMHYGLGTLLIIIYNWLMTSICGLKKNCMTKGYLRAI
jgi:hypothetical protein